MTGFAFETWGWGNAIPTTLRFTVEGATGGPLDEYCTSPMMPLNAGTNRITFDQLASPCYFSGGEPPSGNGILRIRWQVVTNPAQTTPFDFCVANVRALTD